MSTSLLYHAFGIRGYHYTRSEYQGGQVIFTIRQEPRTIDAAGNLFGTTNGGGANSDGTLFELANGSNTITTLASFDGANGFAPDSGVTFDAAGNLYGLASHGGANNGDGTVFELTTSAVPEPSSVVLLGLGVASLASWARWSTRP